MKQTVRDIYANRLEELQYQHKMGFISDKEYVDERVKALQIYTTAMILEAWRLNQIMKEEMIEKINLTLKGKNGNDNNLSKIMMLLAHATPEKCEAVLALLEGRSQLVQEKTPEGIVC